MFPKKSLGQNFLHDMNIIKKIVDLTKVKGKHIIEIGPGRGSLTDEILSKNPKSLILIEKDSILSKKLSIKYKNNKEVRVFNNDILSYDLEKRVNNNSVIFGNLPYNISSQILVKFLRLKKWPPQYSTLIFMFQKEMAERIIGKYGTKKYGRLSILTNYKLNVLKSFDVSPNCFFPVPKVLSTVISFRPKTKVLNIKKIENLEKISNILFSGKRKMINKNMKKLFNKKDFDYISKNIKLNLRPSELRPEIFYKITEFYEKVN